MISAAVEIPAQLPRSWGTVNPDVILLGMKSLTRVVCPTYSILSLFNLPVID